MIVPVAPIPVVERERELPTVRASSAQFVALAQNTRRNRMAG